MSSEFLGILKTIGYILSVSMFQYLNIPSEQIAILGALMVIDTMTGIGKQYRVDPRDITSNKLWLGIIKKTATLMAVFALSIIFKGIHVSGDGYIPAMLGLLIMSEGYSILQNIYAIRTGNILPEYDVISYAIKTAGDYIRGKIDAIINSKQ